MMHSQEDYKDPWVLLPTWAGHEDAGLWLAVEPSSQGLGSAVPVPVVVAMPHESCLHLTAGPL
jgi:hypothetical protein